MGIGANSYGSTAEVAALVGRYTSSGSFSSSTHPTTTQVEKFIDRVSAICNALLAEAGFDIPVDEADPKLVLDHFVVDHVHLLCHAANGAGPYAPGSEALRRVSSPFQIIWNEAANFFAEHAQGLEQLGASRSRHMTYGLKARTVDDNGDEILGPFQWKQVGHEIVDWDVAD